MHRRHVLMATLLAAGVFLLPPLAAGAKTAPSLTGAKAQAVKLQNDIGVLDGRLKVADGRYTLAKQDLIAVQAQVAANERQLAAAVRRLALEKQHLAERAVAAYKAPSTELLNVLLEARSFSDLANGVGLVQRINDEGEALVGQLTPDQESDRSAPGPARERPGAGRGAGHAGDPGAGPDRGGAAATPHHAAERQGQGETYPGADRRREGGRGPRRRRPRRRRRRAAPRHIAGFRCRRLRALSWAQALLADAHLPLTSSNLAAMVAWEMAEGGNWYNGATCNPLDTTMPEPGATSMNWVGVKAYTSWTEGFTATLATLFNGDYEGILAALRRGNDAQAVADAVAASPWGTEPFVVA